MSSVRQIEANRLNAQKSTGPVTVEGKERSRENALTHGLAAEVVLRITDLEIAATRTHEWRESVKPVNNVDEYLLSQMAVAAVRIDRCQAHEEKLREQAVARASASWDEDRALDAERTALKLAANPALARLELRRTPHGCAWLLARWAMLVGVLRGGGAWTPPQESLALDLLGTAAELRDCASPLDVPAADLLALAESEVESLRGRSEQVAPLDAAERRSAGLGLPSEPDRMMTLVRRYEATASRQLRWALKVIKGPHPMWTVTPGPYLCEPPVAITPARAAPEPYEPPARNEPDGALGEAPALASYTKPAPSSRDGKRSRRRRT